MKRKVKGILGNTLEIFSYLSKNKKILSYYWAFFFFLRLTVLLSLDMSPLLIILIIPGS